MTLLIWVTFLTLSTMMVLVCEQIFPVLWRLLQRGALKKAGIELKLCAQPMQLFNQKLLYDFYEHKNLIINEENVLKRYHDDALLYEIHGMNLTLDPSYWPLVSSFSIKVGERLSLQNYAICFQELIELKVFLDGQWELAHDSNRGDCALSIAALSALQEPAPMRVAL